MPRTAKEPSTRSTRAVRKKGKSAGDITSAASLVAAFGGAAKCADWCHTDVGQVAEWLVCGHIPNGWHFRMFWYLTRRGYSIDPYALGWTIDGLTPAAARKAMLTQHRLMYPFHA